MCTHRHTHRTEIDSQYSFYAHIVKQTLAPPPHHCVVFVIDEDRVPHFHGGCPAHVGHSVQDVEALKTGICMKF